MLFRQVQIERNVFMNHEHVLMNHEHVLMNHEHVLMNHEHVLMNHEHVLIEFILMKSLTRDSSARYSSNYHGRGHCIMAALDALCLLGSKSSFLVFHHVSKERNVFLEEV